MSVDFYYQKNWGSDFPLCWITKHQWTQGLFQDLFWSCIRKCSYQVLLDYFRTWLLDHFRNRLCQQHSHFVLQMRIYEIVEHIFVIYLFRCKSHTNSLEETLACLIIKRYTLSICSDGRFLLEAALPRNFSTWVTIKCS